MTMCQCAGCYPEREARKAFYKRRDEPKQTIMTDKEKQERVRQVVRFINANKQPR